MDQTRNEDTDESPPESESGWAELTHECLSNIIARLSLEHRWRAMLVCKSWLLACKDPHLNSGFVLEPESVPESARWWAPDLGRKVDSILRSVAEWSQGSLREIRTRNCSNASLSFVAQRCPNLEVLSIKSCPNVTDASMADIAFRCPMIKELDISYCHEISHAALLLIGRNCPNLTIVKRNALNLLDPSEHAGIVPDEYLKTCPQDGNSEANAIGKSMPNLKHLELRFSKVTAKGLGLISAGCLKLEYLDVFGCTNLTNRDINNATSELKNLKEIKKPNFYIPRSVFHTERYGHWRLYDERFQTDVFRI
ncbi:PREDICTED: F-box protein SKIP1 [Fragaria vesca subsp. vesca]|uniref:F-box protein SKIP1 n=1 Tax=Fragaria vesca subsp. vesca TaxID=101020 RepID=UPI0002C343EC|nr:PREDICTED: F-box protein SKIP1 [Fragaria vesca subsp. vesca]